MAMQDLQNKFRKLENGSNVYEPVALRQAAVLVGLFYRENEWHVLLTRRSHKLKSHSGQVCLPGGKTDEGETNIETALREADEEVGLKRNCVSQILGELPPRLSCSLVVSHSSRVSYCATHFQAQAYTKFYQQYDRR